MNIPWRDDEDGPDRLFPGARADNLLTFTDGLHELSPGLNAETWTSLFQGTAGWMMAGQAVLQGAAQSGIDLNRINPSQYPDTISTAVQSQIRNETVDSSGLRLAHLLSFIHIINRDTIELTFEAVQMLGQLEQSLSADDDVDQLTSSLLGQGLIRPVMDARVSQYEVPAVLCPILQRILVAKNRHSEARSKRLLSTVFAKALKSPRAYEADYFGEILLQSADNGHWSVLTQLWADRGHSLFADHFDAAAAAYSKVPSDHFENSAVLAEAMGAAEQVNATKIKLRTEDPNTVLAELAFESSTVPSLTSRSNQIEKGAFTGDDIVAMSISSMRNARLLNESERGLDAARQGWKLIVSRERYARAPTRLNDSRFHAERGITSLSAGHIKDSTQHLRRSMLIAEAASSPSAYVLAPAYAYGALAQSVAGSGRVSDDFLNRYRELAQVKGFNEPLSRPAYQLTRLVRAIDELDLDSAHELSAEIPDPVHGHHLWRFAAMFSSILGVVSGDARMEEKRLSQIHETEAPATDEMIRVSRVYLLMAQGHTHLIHADSLGSSSNSPVDALINARFNLSVGEYGIASGLANRIQFHNDAPIRVKASARAIRSACLLRNGHASDAQDAFVDALESCRIASTVLPIALLSKPIRDQLIWETTNTDLWESLARSFDNDRLSGMDLRNRLLNLGETILEKGAHVHLDTTQRELLALLDSKKTSSRLPQHWGWQKVR